MPFLHKTQKNLLPLSFILLLAILSLRCGKNGPSLQITQTDSPTTSLLQAISMVNEDTVWISGHNATFLRSTDAGESWELFRHPTGDSLQFRDIHGFDHEKAILMSAGPGALSRIFTFQSPDRWEENFVMQDSLGFLDCIDFWDDKRGIAYGDAIDLYPYILLTEDGGQSWYRADTSYMPKAGKGEGGFAASGTCVTTGADGIAWIATGAGGHSRIFITRDYGHSWQVIQSPIIRGEAAGNTSVSFVNETGLLVGGDLLISDHYTENCAFSRDAGQTWMLSSQPQTVGAFYGSAITKVDHHVYAFACGPRGLDYTKDFGQTWRTLDTLNYWAVSVKGHLGFAVGKDGTILRIKIQ